MKRLIQIALVITVALALATVSANAQMPIKFGFKGGVNIANVTGGDSGGYESKSGIMGGLFASLSLGSGLSLQPELLYVQKGAKRTAEDSASSGTLTLQMNYIEIPVLIKYGFKSGGAVTPCLFAGPAFGFNKSSKTEVEGTLMGIPASGDVDNYNEVSSDLSFVLGGGVDFSLGTAKLTLELRYTSGTKVLWEDVDIDNLPDYEWVYADDTGKALDMKNSVISVMVGLMF